MAGFSTSRFVKFNDNKFNVEQSFCPEFLFIYFGFYICFPSRVDENYITERHRARYIFSFH